MKAKSILFHDECLVSKSTSLQYPTNGLKTCLVLNMHQFASEMPDIGYFLRKGSIRKYQNSKREKLGPLLVVHA